VEDAVYAPPEVVRLIAEIAAELAGPVGRAAALALPRAFRRLKASQLHGKHVVLLVDDVARPLGLDRLEGYAKNLLNLVEELLAVGAASVLALATTSEGGRGACWRATTTSP